MTSPAAEVGDAERATGTPFGSTEITSRKTIVAITVALALLCIACLVAHALTYLPYFPDDAFISLRYSHRLLEGKGLTWTDGERVEGFTNFLWVVTVAGIGASGAELVTAARVLGLVGMSAVIVAFFFISPVTRPIRALPPLGAGLTFAAAGPVAAYAISGLEHPLLVALLIWGIVTCYPLMESDCVSWRQVWLPGTLLGLCCTVRPDAPLMVAMVCLAVAVGGGLSSKRLVVGLRLAVIPTACFSALLLFRRLYFSDWVPNTYYAKVALTEERLKRGWDYVSSGGSPFLGLLVLAALAIAISFADTRFRRRVLLALLPVIAWLSYLTFIGGDNMPQRRHLVPAIALLALIATNVLAWMVERRFGWKLAALLLGPAVAVQVTVASFRDPQRPSAQHNTWMWKGEPVGRFLKLAFGEQQPLMAVDAAGSLPYFSELPVLDMLGLNDRYIARHRPESFGHGKLAHELGDGDYVMRRKPDLIAFHTSRGEPRPMWLSGRQMIRRPDFKRLYQLVTFRTPGKNGLTSYLWVRTQDSMLAVKREENRIIVPGYLVTMREGNVAELDSDGKLGATATRELPATLRRFRLAPGRWELSADTERAVEVRVQTEAGAELGRGEGSVEVEVPGERQVLVLVEIRPEEGETAHVRQLSFTRR
ncbi:MAG: hypothetical protein WBM46_20300 [Polyangiales bacterium]